MFLADSNIWLALALSKHAFHETVHAWLRTQKRRKSLLFCRATQQSFLRLLTTGAVLAPYGIPPLSNNEAWSVYEGLLHDKRVAEASEPRGLLSQWKKLSGGANASPKLWMDAYLAAFAIRGGYRLVTIDSAFTQFQALDLLLFSA